MQDLHPPWTLFESVASTRWANGSDSPCLLVKGADCAGDVLPVRDAVICRSLEAGPCRSAWCRCWALLCQAVSRRTALFSYVPRANRAGGRGTLWLCRARSTYRIVWWLSSGINTPSIYPENCDTVVTALRGSPESCASPCPRRPYGPTPHRHRRCPGPGDRAKASPSPRKSSRPCMAR